MSMWRGKPRYVPCAFDLSAVTMLGTDLLSTGLC